MELTKIFASKDNQIIKPKTTKNRSTKKDLYKKEQEELLAKINNILGINKDNNIVYLYDIENDAEKKKQILALSDDVKKCFKYSKWGFYSKEECKDNHVLLCKSIYKEMGYDILSKPIYMTRNNEKIRTIQYTIGKVTVSL